MSLLWWWHHVQPSSEAETAFCVFSWVRFLFETHTRDTHMHVQTHSRVYTVCFSSFFWRAVTGCRIWGRLLWREGNPSVLPSSLHPPFVVVGVLCCLSLSPWWLLMWTWFHETPELLKPSDFFWRFHYLDREKLLVVVVVIVVDVVCQRCLICAASFSPKPN